jgi:hypothetical protein
VLPLVAQHLEAETLRTVTAVALGAGTLLLAYLLAGNPRWISIGAVMAAAGYALQWFGMLKRRAAGGDATAGIGQHA